MTAIVDIIGREILDSRGNPTVEVDVILRHPEYAPSDLMVLLRSQSSYSDTLFFSFATRERL